LLLSWGGGWLNILVAIVVLVTVPLAPRLLLSRGSDSGGGSALLVLVVVVVVVVIVVPVVPVVVTGSHCDVNGLWRAGVLVPSTVTGEGSSRGGSRESDCVLHLEKDD